MSTLRKRNRVNGRTPLESINGVKHVAKLEYFILQFCKRQSRLPYEDANKRILKPGDTIIEPTSGNTGKESHQFSSQGIYAIMTSLNNEWERRNF